jgi:hypothetical protein
MALSRTILAAIDQGTAPDSDELKSNFAELEVLRATAAKACGPKYQKGLRLDLRVFDTASEEEVWVDVTAIHPTCRTRISNELKRVNENLSLPLRSRARLPGRAVADQQAFKHQTYLPLLSIARKQVADGKRQSVPLFLGAVCSTFGEFRHDLVKLQ